MTTTVEETDVLARNLATLPQYRTRNRPGGLAEDAVAHLLSTESGDESYTRRVLLVHSNQPHGHMWQVTAERIRQQAALAPFTGAYGWYIGATDNYLGEQVAVGTGTPVGAIATPEQILAASVNQYRVRLTLNRYLTAGTVVPFIRETRAGRIGVALAPPGADGSEGMWRVDEGRVASTPALRPFLGWRAQWCYDYEVEFVSDTGTVPTATPTATHAVDLSAVPEEHRATIPAEAFWVSLNQRQDLLEPGEFLVVETGDPSHFSAILWPGHPFTHGSHRTGVPREPGWSGYTLDRSRCTRLDRPAVPVAEEWQPVPGARCRVTVSNDSERAVGKVGVIERINRADTNTPYLVIFDEAGQDIEFTWGEDGDRKYWVTDVEAETPAVVAEPEFDRLAVGNWYSWGTRGRWYRLAGPAGGRMRTDAYINGRGDTLHLDNGTTQMPFEHGRTNEVTYGPTIGSDGTPTPDWIRALFPQEETETGSWLDDYPVGHFFTVAGVHGGEVFVVSAHRDGQVEYTARPEDSCGTGLFNEDTMRASEPYVEPTVEPTPEPFVVGQRVHVDYPAWEGDGTVVTVNLSNTLVRMDTGRFTGREGTFHNSHITALTEPTIDLSAVPEEHRGQVPANARWMTDEFEGGTMMGERMLVIDDPCHGGADTMLGLLWPGHPRFGDAFADNRSGCGVPVGWRGWRTSGYVACDPPVPAEVTIDFPIVNNRHLVPAAARVIRLRDTDVQQHPAGTYMAMRINDRWALISEPGMSGYERAGWRDESLTRPLRAYRVRANRIVEDLGPVPAVTAPTVEPTVDEYPFPEIPVEHRDTAPAGLMRLRVADNYDGTRVARGSEVLGIEATDGSDRWIIAWWPGHPMFRYGYDRSDRGVDLPWRGYTMYRRTLVPVEPVPVDVTDVEALRARLAQVEREYAEDLATIARMMNEQAVRREWCEEYEQVMARINRETHADFSMAQRPVRIIASYRVAGFMSGTADVEVPQGYSGNDIHRAVHAMLTGRGRIDTTGGVIDMSAVTLDMVTISSYDERD